MKLKKKLKDLRKCTYVITFGLLHYTTMIAVVVENNAKMYYYYIHELMDTAYIYDAFIVIH